MKKFERKDFLKMTGGAVVGGITGNVLAGGPFDALQWTVDWTQDQHTPPTGEERFPETVCTMCPNRCDLSVRTIGNRAVNVSNSNRGCPVGQNALQLCYHPERITRPLKRSGGKGSDRFEPVSWEEALKEITGKVQEKIQGEKRHMIAGVTGDSGTASLLLERLVRALGSSNAYREPCQGSLAAAALGGMVNYDFQNADYILTFGARILEGWGLPDTITQAFKNWKNRNARFVHIDTTMTRTAAMADEWIAIKPGTELFLAMGIAYHLIRERGKTSGAAGFANWSSYINQFPPENVAKITGVQPDKIREIANAFSAAARPMAVGGRGTRGVSSSSAELTAVYALNDLVNTRMATITGPPSLGAPSMSAAASASLDANEGKKGLDEFARDGSFELMFINEADPVYRSVNGTDLTEKLDSAYVVQIAPLKNNTSLQADIILPSLSFLEAPSARGEAVVPPRGESRHGARIVLDIARGIEEVREAFPWNDYRRINAGTAATRPFSFESDVLKEKLSQLKKLLASGGGYPLYLVPSELAFMGDGGGAAYPYVWKNIDRHTYSRDRLWVHINRQTARENGISEGEKLRIESSRGETGKVRAHLTDTVAPGVISVPLGFGHRSFTRYAQGKGVNPKEIMNSEIDPLSGTADWYVTRVKIS